jgi:hypothetical protein
MHARISSIKAACLETHNKTVSGLEKGSTLLRPSGPGKKSQPGDPVKEQHPVNLEESGETQEVKAWCALPG